MERKSFEYGGFHFYPLRTFDEADGDFYARVFKSREDRELGFTSSDEPWSKYPYNYEDFYKAAGGKVFDVFFCEENGKQYVPCSDELRVYLNPPIKNKNNRTIR